MKTKNNYVKLSAANLRLFFIGNMFIFLIFYSCQKEEEININENSTIIEVVKRNGPDVNISYDLTTNTKTEPESGNLSDLCIEDILTIAYTSTVSNVEMNITSIGEVCLTINSSTSDPLDRGRGNDRSRNIKTKYCGGELETNSDGTTTTISPAIQNEYFIQIYNSVFLDEDEKETLFDQMLENYENNGATIVVNGNGILVTEIDANGNVTETLFDSKNKTILGVRNLDNNGEVTSVTYYSYACTEDGTKIPSKIVRAKKSETAFCKTPVVNTVTMQYENYKIQ